MDLRINKFKLRYQGQDYGPGEVIYEVSDDIGKKLVADSKGAIEALPERQQAPAVNVSTPAPADDANKKTDKDATTNQKAEDTVLPSVDPAKTVK